VIGLAVLSSLRYAVIEALRVDADPERFVIAYCNEQALHAVIAAPCIVAFGFSSREKAEASKGLRIGGRRLEADSETAGVATEVIAAMNPDLGREWYSVA
jgi:hypothetical protein